MNAATSPLSPDSATGPASPVRRIEIILLILAGVLSSIWCVTAASKLSATFDEPVYLHEGMKRWRTGSYAGLMKLGTMPLPVDVQTLPLYLFELARGETLDLQGDFGKLLPYARAMTLLFWWMLLYYAWRIGRDLGGPWAGVGAALLLACEPNFVAHASLATTDIAIAACLLALAHHFAKNREKGWGWRVAWPACWFALAILAKASGLVFGGLCLLAIEALRCRWWRAEGTSFRASFRDFMHIGLLGMALVFLYVGSDFERQRSWVAHAKTLPAGPWASAMTWLSDNLRLFSNAGDGLVRQVRHNMRGHGTYILGVEHARSLWYYFPLLLTIKIAVPVLLASLLLGGVQAWRRRWEGNWPLLCALALLVFSLNCRVQIGVRFMFPLVALAAIGGAVVFARLLRDSSLPARRLLVGVAACLVLWTASASAAVWPHGLAYVNPLWGGTRDGYKLVSDANYDWGQGVKELARWQRKTHADNLDVWAFSMDPMVQRLPARLTMLHQMEFATEAEFLGFVRGRKLAVSTTLVYGRSCEGPAVRMIADLLRKKQPAARTTTFLIYDFTDNSDPI